MTPNTESLQKTKAGRISREEVTMTVPFPEAFVYTNVSAMSVSQMDVRIGFAEVGPLEGKPISRVGVAMPLEHAAQLALNLLQQLMFFEKNFGPIRNRQWRRFMDRGQPDQLNSLYEDDGAESEKEPSV
jgi:hypothetical protein